MRFAPFGCENAPDSDRSHEVAKANDFPPQNVMQMGSRSRRSGPLTGMRKCKKFKRLILVDPGVIVRRVSTISTFFPCWPSLVVRSVVAM